MGGPLRPHSGYVEPRSPLALRPSLPLLRTHTLYLCIFRRAGVGGGLAAVVVLQDSGAALQLQLRRCALRGNAASVSGGGAAALNLQRLGVASSVVSGNTCRGGMARCRPRRAKAPLRPSLSCC